MKKEEIVNLNRTLLYVSFGNMSKAGKSAMMRNLVRLGKTLEGNRGSYEDRFR